MDALKWITITYAVKELVVGGDVVTQRSILEQWKTDNPDQEIRAHAGFKCDQQDMTVSIRIAIADDSIAVGTVAKIESVWAGENRCLCGASGDNIKLQEKYDELKAERDRLIEMKETRIARINELKEKHDILVEENDKLQRESGTVIKLYDNVRKELAETVAWNSTLKGENDRLTLLLVEFDEDSADLIEAKKAIVEDDGISLDEVDMPEGELDDGTPDCCSDGTVPGDDDMTEQELDEDYIAGDDA